MMILEGRPRPFIIGRSLITEFPIPAGWHWVRVGEVCDLQTGATPSTRRPEYFGGDIDGWFLETLTKVRYMTVKGESPRLVCTTVTGKILPADSVLIALNGQGKTRASVAILRVPAACNQSLVAIIPFCKDILIPEYLYLSLKYRYYEIRDITGQKQRRGLNMGLVSRLSIPSAPIDEQECIVAKVDQLMALCDKLESQQNEQEKLRDWLGLSVQTANQRAVSSGFARGAEPGKTRDTAAISPT